MNRFFKSAAFPILLLVAIAFGISVAVRGGPGPLLPSWPPDPWSCALVGLTFAMFVIDRLEAPPVVRLAVGTVWVLLPVAVAVDRSGSRWECAAVGLVCGMVLVLNWRIYRDGREIRRRREAA